MERIKVFAINTSPRKGRNTEQLLDEVLAGCLSMNTDGGVHVSTKLMGVCDAAAENFKMCRGCWACAKTGQCVCGDDFIKDVYDEIETADIVIFGVPVYFYSVSAQCKAIMDRALAYMPVGDGKITVSAITCGSAGVVSTLQALQSFYSCHNFIDAGWVATYGKTSDKEKGKAVAYDLGRKAVRLASVVKSAVNGAEERGDDAMLKDLKHGNHFAYGTHTF